MGKLTKTITALILALLLSVVVSCITVKEAKPGNTPAELPDGWPISELTLPEDAVKVAVFVGGASEPIFSISGGDVLSYGPRGEVKAKHWQVGFSSSMSFEDLVAHIETCLDEARIEYYMEDPEVIESMFGKPPESRVVFVCESELTDISLSSFPYPFLDDAMTYEEIVHQNIDITVYESLPGRPLCLLCFAGLTEELG